MHKNRTAPLARVWAACRALTRVLASSSTQVDPVNGLPTGLSDRHLRDIGLSRQQIYLYRQREATPPRF